MFGSILPQFRHPWGSHFRSFLVSFFCSDFAFLLMPLWHSSWPPKASQKGGLGAPRGLQRTRSPLPKSLLWRFWRPRSREAAKMESHGPPRVSKRSPGEILGGFWKDIGRGVERFREGFNVILRGFREDVGKALGRFVGTGGT